MTRRRSSGRYGTDQNARMPAGGLAKPPPSKNVQVVRAAVDDPMEPGKRLYVAANRFVDVLEIERSHRRISEAAYCIGRELQATFEAASRIGGGGQWSDADRVDPVVTRDAAIVRKIDHSTEIIAKMNRLSQEVGLIGARFLRDILGSAGSRGMTFLEVAARDGATDRKSVARVACRFRDLLEDIARTRQARGVAMRRPEDKHDVAAKRACAGPA